MYLVIKYKGNPVASLKNEPLGSVYEHIKNGYPRLLDAWKAGDVTAEIVSDVSGISFSPLPVTEDIIREGLLRIFLEDRFDVENRIRVLEGEAPISKQVFIDAVKARLGL